ncbi:MAG: serine hydrolase [Candidatus Sericytochromatia bacterium]|uniref:Serine hydrolase n=1 Tax=Candidatus Tanganyikabacteria bacterium TaxID=2961651 RepID=A0A937X6J7_9BACT|nr:serine hydrolase [Candidatus Tanganyikabacteria bacterium]
MRFLPAMAASALIAVGCGRAPLSTTPVAPGTLATPAGALHAAAADPALQAVLEKSLPAHGFTDAGAVLQDLESDRSAVHRATAIFGSASIIKIAVMAEVHRQYEAGLVARDGQVTIERRNYTDTWKPVLRVGDRVSVSRLVDLMITKSDNVATNTLVDIVRRQNLNAFMARLGLGDIQFHHKLSGGSVPVSDPDYDGGRNQISASAVARLLASIAAGTLVNAEESARMKEILGRQEDSSKIPGGLPAGARVFHKTGETSKLTHDAAIVEVEGRRYVMVILANRAPGGNTYRAFGSVARDLDRALAGPARIPYAGS